MYADNPSGSFEDLQYLIKVAQQNVGTDRINALRKASLLIDTLIIREQNELDENQA